MTATQKKLLQALYDRYRQDSGDFKLDYKPVMFLRQQEREVFVGWLLETLTPGVLEEYLGKSFDEGGDAANVDSESTIIVQ